MRPSAVRSNIAPHASSSRTRSGASFACSSAMRQLFTYWPPRIVSAKCTRQLSRSSTFASAAAMPPSAITVCALPSRDLHTRPTDAPVADADAELHRAGRRVLEPRRVPRVEREDGEHEDGDEQHVAVNVLENQRKRVLAAVRFARLADAARWRIGPERLVVGAAIVVAGESEQRRYRKDEQCRREWQPRRPCGGLRTETAGRRRPVNLRRIERRDVRTEAIVIALECRPRRVHDERGESDEDEERLDPPRVTSRGVTEPRRDQW